MFKQSNEINYLKGVYMRVYMRVIIDVIFVVVSISYIAFLTKLIVHPF